MQWSELDGRVIDCGGMQFRGRGRVIDFGGMQFGDAGPPLSALVCAIHMQAALFKAVNYTWIEKVRARSPYPCHYFTNSHSISVLCCLHLLQGQYKVPEWLQTLNGLPGLTERFLRQSAQASLVGMPFDESDSAAPSQATDLRDGAISCLYLSRSDLDQLGRTCNIGPI